MPGGCLDLRNRVAAVVCHPHVSAVKGDAVGISPDANCPYKRPIAHVQNGDVVAAEVRHPHVGSVEGQVV